MGTVYRSGASELERLARSNTSRLSDWMRAVRAPTPHRVGSSFHLNTTRLAKFGIIMLLALTMVVLLIPATDYNPKASKRLSLHPRYNSTYPLTAPTRTSNGVTYRIGVISDLDTDSKSPDKKNTWISYFKKGHLTINPDQTKLSVTWDKEVVTLQSTLATKGRGMELSELVAFNGRLYTCDDRTGVIYEITPDNRVLPWVVLNDGDGRKEKGVYLAHVNY